MGQHFHVSARRRCLWHSMEHRRLAAGDHEALGVAALQRAAAACSWPPHRRAHQPAGSRDGALSHLDEPR